MHIRKRMGGGAMDLKSPDQRLVTGESRRPPGVYAAEAMAVTVQELAKHFKLSADSDLGQQVSDEHIKEISTFLESWKLVAPHLGLNQGTIETIDSDGKGEEQKRLLMLQKWKQALFFKATYQKLLEALLAVQRADLGGKVCELVTASAHHSAHKLGE